MFFPKVPMVTACGRRTFSTRSCHFSKTKIYEDKVQTVGETKINYSTSGHGKHAVLLLPGALGTGLSDFRPQLEGLNSTGNLTLVAWDPPGYGKSRPPERRWSDNFYESDARYAKEFMESLGHNQFSIVGWSDGGITALIMAGLYKRSIKKMVALAANAYFEEEDLDMILKVRDVSQWSSRMRAPMEEVYGKDYFPILWEQWCVSILNLASKTADRNICKELLEKIHCPCLIMHGAKDAMVASEHPDMLHRSIKGSRLVVFPDGKHNLHFKYKERFNEIVESFLLES